MAEGQADARAALRWVLGVLRTLVRVHAVHPPRVGCEAHDEERVVRQRDALRAPDPAPTTLIMILIPLPLLLASILLCPERHRAPRADREVHDA